jgi:uncharacterized membrane protein
VDAQFCPNCGKAVAGTSGATYIPPASSASAQPGLTVNAASALCYLFGFVTGVIFLVVAPYNQDRRVRFHAYQSIFLNVAVIAVHVGITFLALAFHAVSVVLGVVVSSLHAIASLGFFLLWIYMMWKSYEGEKIVLPFIGPLAESQAGGSNSPSGTVGKAA